MIFEFEMIQHGYFLLLACDAHYTIDDLQDESSPSFSRVPSTDNSSSRYPVEEVGGSANTVGGSFLKRIETFCHPNPVKDDSTPDSATGIKIQPRQPRNPSSWMNFTSQGTASRRMRFWLGPKSDSNHSDRSKKDGSESLSSEVSSIFSCGIIWIDSSTPVMDIIGLRILRVNITFYPNLWSFFQFYPVLESFSILSDLFNQIIIILAHAFSNELQKLFHCSNDRTDRQLKRSGQN